MRVSLDNRIEKAGDLRALKLLIEQVTRLIALLTIAQALYKSEATTEGSSLTSGSGVSLLGSLQAISPMQPAYGVFSMHCRS